MFSNFEVGPGKVVRDTGRRTYEQLGNGIKCGKWPKSVMNTLLANDDAVIMQAQAFQKHVSH